MPIVLPVVTSVQPDWVSRYGQTEHQDVPLMGVFGFLINTTQEPYIPDHAARAVSLLIEQFRKPYYVYTN